MSMTNVERQIELEKEAAQLGAERYRAQVEAAKGYGTESTLPPMAALMHSIVGPMSKAIVEDRELTRAKGGGRSASVLKFLQKFDPDLLAFVACRCVMDGVSQQRRLQGVALEISGHLQDILLNQAYEEQAPGLKKKLQKDLKNKTPRHSQVVHRLAANRCGIERENLSISEAQRVGVRLIEMFCETTGLARTITVGTGKRKVAMIQATDELMDWITKRNSRCELLSPLLLPMVCQPVEWTRPRGGGYITLNKHRAKLIKTPVDNYIEELEGVDLSRVYGAVNALQNTPWKINKGVLGVLREVWDNGGVLGGLPMSDLEPLPMKPHDIADNEESRRAWRQAAAKVHERNNTLRSKRVAVTQRIWIAEKFADEGAIYFPWQLDWRGRAYPIPSLLHPQADDIGKSLLQFATGKPLGESGGFWLAVHIANLFGVDKVSFAERVQWVQDNHDAILDSGVRPLDGQRFWTEADKPWCALAACMEWAGFNMMGNDYVSHLPIAMDGSCNGLQNLSAMLRDEVGGAAVNLVPGQKPNDIYAQVAKVVSAKADDMEELAPWRGKVNRSLVKRPVMTLPYGSTKVGMRAQIIDHLKKCMEKRELEALPMNPETGEIIEDYYFEANTLAAVVYDSIGDVVIAARKVMDWLQESAKVASKNGLPIHWTTPVGLPVQQMYMETKAKELDFKFGKVRYRLVVAEYTDKVNKRKMANGISPNFVHSMDAAHMMMTVEYCKAAGIESFAMIHDSYGTHAADCETMFTLLRRAFVDIYSGDVLQEFRDALIEQLPEELAAEIPPLPEKGNLDLEAVMESDYFFA